jgi:hypothetical protein
MRAQVATFAGWPMPSQSGRLKRPQKCARSNFERVLYGQYVILLTKSFFFNLKMYVRHGLKKAIFWE